MGDDLCFTGFLEEGVGLAFWRAGEGGETPSGVRVGAAASKLEEAFEGFQGEGDEAKESACVHADGHVDLLAKEVYGALSGEGDVRGAGDEVFCLGDSVNDGEVS